MHRMIQSKQHPSTAWSRTTGLRDRFVGLFAMLGLMASAAIAMGQGYPVAGYPTTGVPTSGVAQANLDFAASGIVMPAGGAFAGMPAQGDMQPQGAIPPHAIPGGVAQVGFFPGSGASFSSRGMGCDSCDGGGCSSCEMGGCEMDGCGCSPFEQGCGCGLGMRDRLMQGGCGCGGLSEMRRFCLFCRGDGCTACQSVGGGRVLGGIGAFLGSLRPYGGAGLGAQRWYDLSAEAVWLGHTSGGGNGVLTTQGVSGTPVLTLGQAGSSDLELGYRLSASMIFGVGGNIEATYLGGQEWDGSASVSSAGADLFSFISAFGTNPGGVAPGFDDTDRSLSHSIRNSSRFHSGEINYRRRTVGAYNRFQGSWLVGLRYLRYDDELLYETRGQDNNTAANNGTRFFSSLDSQQNSMLGVQGGFDLWWNVTPGVNFGLGMKGGWLNNDVDRSTVLSANSLGPGATIGTRSGTGGADTDTLMADFELKLVYRLSHSWSFRTAYYAMAIEDVAYGTSNASVVQGFVQNANLPSPAVEFDSLVLQGFSVGAEYLW